MVFDERKLLEAMRHPIRRRVLLKLSDGEASPSMLSRSLGESLGTVSYHTRKLRDMRCIELVRTAQRRGAIEHVYRAVTTPLLDDDAWGRLPPADRRRLTGTTLRELSRELSGAVPQGRFDPPGAHVIRIPLSLDAAGWKELAVLVQSFIDDVKQLEAHVDSRTPGDDGTTPSSLALLHYVATES